MVEAHHWLFAPFRLDADNALLWQGPQAIPLKPKTFAVLQHLVAHAGRLATKEDLLDAVWPETAVGDAVLKVCIAELRKALGDTARTPRFIATVHRRGYRFIASVTLVPTGETGWAAPRPRRSSDAAGMPSADLPPLLASLPPPPLVERDAMLQHLHAVWAQACQGRRQVVFVTGAAGIGKTAVVQAFAAAVRRDPTVWLAYGQCVEHYGTSEAYLPVLEALGQLCRGPGGARLVTLLRQQAPTWLVQMPWLLSAADREQLRYELQGATRERMLRECAEAVDTLTAETPLVLVLEDLHWSDYATLELLALLARRQTPAHLLVVGTYWPIETLGPHHPLRTMVQDVQRHSAATELPLAVLSVAAVAAYLAARFPQQQFPAALAPWLQQRTDGNPLFLVTIVQAFVERGVLQEQDGRWTVQGRLEAIALDVPESLRRMLEQQITRLPRRRPVWRPTKRWGIRYTTWAHSPRPGRISSRGSPSPTRQRSRPWCCAMARRWACAALAWRPSSCGIWAIQRRLSGGVLRRWPWRRSWPIPIVWRSPITGRPTCITTAARRLRSGSRPAPS